MHHTLTFEWNDKLVATAQATAVMAYEFADGFYSDQFSGQAFNDWYGHTFINLLDQLLEAQRYNTRRTWTLEWKDETGHAKLIIRC